MWALAIFHVKNINKNRKYMAYILILALFSPKFLAKIMWVLTTLFVKHNKIEIKNTECAHTKSYKIESSNIFLYNYVIE
jgi:hypothetical protein